MAPLEREMVPAGHWVHASVPMWSLYVPARQALHGPPAAPVYPRSHEQFVMVNEYWLEYVLEGQAF